MIRKLNQKKFLLYIKLFERLKINTWNNWIFLLLFSKKKCTKVTVKLEVYKIIVFNKEINIGLKNLIFLWGQFNLNTIEGANELWRKFQKNEINKNISVIINKVILNLVIFMI